MNTTHINLNHVADVPVTSTGELKAEIYKYWITITKPYTCGQSSLKNELLTCNYFRMSSRIISLYCKSNSIRGKHCWAHHKSTQLVYSVTLKVNITITHSTYVTNEVMLWSCWIMYIFNIELCKRIYLRTYVSYDAIRFK